MHVPTPNAELRYDRYTKLTAPLFLILFLLISYLLYKNNTLALACVTPVIAPYCRYVRPTRQPSFVGIEIARHETLGYITCAGARLIAFTYRLC